MSKLALEKEEEPEIILPTFAGIKWNQAGIKTDGRNINNLIYADDMILYIENPKDSTRKLLELINEYSNVAGYKINTQKSLAFPYTNNEKIDKLREIKRN